MNSFHAFPTIVVALSDAMEVPDSLHSVLLPNYLVSSTKIFMDT